uniref:Uncharacterized protein n=1 Tax=Arundo donax TaxID=35708 RepID=A0A0A9GCZ3_ARUDO
MGVCFLYCNLLSYLQLTGIFGTLLSVTSKSASHMKIDIIDCSFFNYMLTD